MVVLAAAVVLSALLPVRAASLHHLRVKFEVVAVATISVAKILVGEILLWCLRYPFSFWDHCAFVRGPKESRNEFFIPG